MRDLTELRGALSAGGPVLGLWAAIPTSLTAEAAAATGADYVVVDQQHGAVDPSGMLAMLQAIEGAGAAPLVRVARNDTWVIGNVLDLGAVGVIVPMVDDAEQAARAVAACRLAPDGERSIGPLRTGRTDGQPPLCLVMVETKRGLENVEAIASTAGLDGIYIGPSDLSLSLGLQLSVRLEQEPLLEAIERVRAVCAERGLIAGMHCLTPQDVPRFTGQGFPMVTIGVDMLYLRQALGMALAAARGGG
jgi:4-hydroxy-2-oxoheptanedioate aldolase